MPIEIPQRRGNAITFAQDEGGRLETSIESLAKLQPIQGGVVTAGNASQQNDAASVCLVVAEDMLETLALTLSAYLVGWAAAGCHPAMMGIGPVPTVESSSKEPDLGLTTWIWLNLTKPSPAKCWRCSKVGAGTWRPLVSSSRITDSRPRSTR